MCVCVCVGARTWGDVHEPSPVVSQVVYQQEAGINNEVRNSIKGLPVIRFKSVQRSKHFNKAAILISRVEKSI